MSKVRVAVWQLTVQDAFTAGITANTFVRIGSELMWVTGVTADMPVCNPQPQTINHTP